jgi:hypothetical protein
MRDKYMLPALPENILGQKATKISSLSLSYGNVVKQAIQRKEFYTEESLECMSPKFVSISVLGNDEATRKVVAYDCYGIQAANQVRSRRFPDLISYLNSVGSDGTFNVLNDSPRPCLVANMRKVNQRLASSLDELFRISLLRESSHNILPGK